MTSDKPQARNLATVPTQPTSTSAPRGESSQKSGVKNPLPIIIVLAILAILGIGASIYAFVQNSVKNSEIADLKAQLESSANRPDGDTDSSGAGSDLTGPAQDVFLLSDALERHPYHLAIKPGDSNAQSGWPSNEDKFYILNTNKLGTNNALKPFDLAGILQPIIDNTIKTSLPDSSTNAIGSITMRSQCNSFDIFYTDPISDDSQRPLFIPTPDEYNPETDVPITANYFCHTDSYDVLYLKATYVININSKKVSTYSTSSDFYNQD